MRILIADKLAEFVTHSLESLGFAVFTDSSLKADSLLEEMKRIDPHILIVRSTKINAAHIKCGSNLALIIRAGAGINTIDTETASDYGIYVANCPGQNVRQCFCAQGWPMEEKSLYKKCQRPVWKNHCRHRNRLVWTRAYTPCKSPGYGSKRLVSILDLTKSRTTRCSFCIESTRRLQGS